MSQLTGFHGEVIYPGQAGYGEAASTPFAAGAPDVVVRPADADAVAEALAYAERADLTVTVRSGGHSMAGLSTDDTGMVIDLAHLDQVALTDSSRRLVSAGGGAKWGRVADAIAPSGLGITAGDTRQVGVGGLTLGGGIGWMVRRFGLAIDSLAGAEVVTADGRVLVADAGHHQDLFWALRGGGGNFGVVTRFDFTAQPVASVHFGSLRYEVADETADVAGLLAGWHELMWESDENLTTTLNLMPPMMGQPATIMLRCCYASGDAAAAERALRPFRGLAAVTADDIAVEPYAKVLEDAMVLPPGFRFESRDVFVADLGPGLAKATAGLFATGRAGIALRGLGGAMARVPADATAFAHRDASVLIGAGLVRPPGVPDGFLDEALAAWDTVAGFGTGTYVNFLSTVTDADVAAAYPPPTYGRLAEVKRAYDPGNIFRRNYNIRP